jgi:hypothetical protein
MSKFKTISGEGKVVSFQGQLRLLSENGGWKQKVEVWLLNSLRNKNNWVYQNLSIHKDLFAGTPLLCAYVGEQIADSHNFEMVIDESGKEVPDFRKATAERIVGYFPSKENIRIEKKDGVEWIVGVGEIFSWYNMQLVEKLKKQGVLSVSIETLIDEYHYEGDTEVFTKYQILGTTLLHETVSPAVEGAHIKALSTLGMNGVKEMTLRVASKNSNEDKQNKNPQTKNNKENYVTMKIKDLQVEGFKVLGANGNKIALLSKEKGEAFISTAEKDNGEIIIGAKTSVNATVSFGEGENAIVVALDSVIDSYMTENSELKAELSQKDTDYETIKTVLNKMQTQETARRKESIKASIKGRLAEIKANSDVDIAENECDDLMADDKINEYVAMEDSEGKFIGDEKARCDVDTRCMSKILEARKNAKAKVFAWERIKDNSEKDENVDDIELSIENILK